MKKLLTCSLLISTYNWPEALHLCLLSVFRQRVLPDEIIICDDGSGPTTQQVIDRMKARSPVPFIHLWQPDEGFQLARMRNKGIARATSDYILQIDGDIILHPHYVKDQLANATKGRFLSGNRYYLNPDVSARVLARQEYNRDLGIQLDRNSWRRLRLPLLQPLMRRYYHWPDEYLYIAGCNMAFWRQDLLDVNGYDENFTGWGWEDTDLALRLMNRHVRLEFIRFGAIQFHIHHREASRDQLNDNYVRVMATRAQKLTSCGRGISQYTTTTADRVHSILQQ